jgi:hypothetical protein
MGGRALSTLALGGVPLSPQPLTHPAAETLAPCKRVARVFSCALVG